MKRFNPQQLYLLGIVYQLGLSVVIPLVICIAGGVWIDHNFDLSPMFTLGGILLGLFLSVYNSYYVLKPLLKSKDKKPKKSEDELVS